MSHLPELPAISIISAVDKNFLIGNSNHLPWQIKEDLQYFRQKTLGHPVIMGKQTWLSLGKPLDGRTNIILTHDRELGIPGCIVSHSISAALSAIGQEEVFVIGGANVFAQFLPIASRLYLTRINHAFTGDTYFPAINWSDWQISAYETATTSSGYDIAFEIWQRI
jgi:dihydrofolate reductase